MKNQIARFTLIAALATVAPSASADDHHGASSSAAPASGSHAPANATPPAPGPQHEPAAPSAHAPSATPTAAPAPAPAAHGHETAPTITPEAALAQLTEGNFRFTAGAADHPRADQNRRCDTFVGGQHPVAAILSCADSRVAPEILFDQGIGDLFVIRVAGNVADTDEIGTIEYGVGHLNIPLIVVIGHTKCGAVTAVVDGAKPEGALGGLLSHIQPAAEITRKTNPNLTGAPLVVMAIRENVRQSIRDLQSHSPGITEAVKSGKVKIVGAVYDIHSGTLTWLDAPSVVGADTQGAHSEAAPKSDPATGMHDAPKRAAAAPASSPDAHAAASQTHGDPNAHGEPVKAAADSHAAKDDHAPAASAGMALPAVRKDNFLALGILLAGASGISMGIFHLMNQLKHRTATTA